MIFVGFKYIQFMSYYFGECVENKYCDFVMGFMKRKVMKV